MGNDPSNILDFRSPGYMGLKSRMWPLWGLLKVFLPKACMQWSLCRWSLAQSFEATAIGSVTRVNLTNMKESVTYGCDCRVLLRDDKRDLTFWTWLDVCWVLDFLELALTKLWTWGELIVIVTGKTEAFIYKFPSYNNVRWCDMLGRKLSQLNDKAQEQEVQKRKQWWINESARQW